MFYTYLWLRYDGTPYYVGKGKGSRGLLSTGHRVHCPPIERVVVQEHPSEVEAFEVEKFFIEFYGRLDLGTGCLANLTEGGEGISGLAEVSRKKISAALKGKPKSEEHCRHMSLANKGKPSPQKGKKSILLGLNKSEDFKKKCREIGKKRKYSEATRKKMSESAKLRYAKEGIESCLRTKRHSFT